MTPIYVSFDTDEPGRINASLFICSYFAISDTEIGLVGAELVGGWDFDADEIYEGYMGEKPPEGMYPYFHEGDLVLGAHEDFDPTDREDKSEAWERLKKLLLKNNFAPEWIGID